MDYDSLLRHYFGTANVGSIDAVALALGREKLAVDFGVERDPGRRFALWTLMHVLGIAPDPRDAFENEKEREAARLFARMAASGGE